MAVKHKKARVSSLVIEITRHCNMKCDHCLRGRAQSVDISEDTLKKLLRPVSYIDTLTLTGGEPSLKPDILMTVLRLCKAYSIPVRQIYLVTNGKKVTEEFLDAVYAWHKYAIMSNIWQNERRVHGDEAHRLFKVCTNNDERDGCTVALSMDRYHEPIPAANIVALSCCPHFVDEKYVQEKYGDQWLITGGRAETNGLGDSTLKDLRPWLFKPEGSVLSIEDLDQDEVSIEDVTCSATGAILKTCDASYTQQRKLAHFTFDQLLSQENWVDRSAARAMYFEKYDRRPPKDPGQLYAALD